MKILLVFSIISIISTAPTAPPPSIINPTNIPEIDRDPEPITVSSDNLIPTTLLPHEPQPTTLLPITEMAQTSTLHTSESTSQQSSTTPTFIKDYQSAISTSTNVGKKATIPPLIQVGLHLQEHKQVATHSTYIEVVIPFSAINYLDRLEDIEKSIRSAADQVISLRDRMTIELENNIFSKHTPDTIHSVCNGYIPSPNTTEITQQQCTNFAFNMFVNGLKANTLHLLADANRRIFDTKKDLRVLNSWFPKVKTTSRPERGTDSDISDRADNPTNNNFNLVGNALADLFGFSTTHDLTLIHQAMIHQQVSNLRVLQTLDKSIIVLDVQSNQINTLNTAVQDLHTISEKITENLRQEIYDNSLFASTLMNTINLNSASHVFTKAHILLSDIKMQISDIEIYFQTALNKKLSVKLISPPLLYSVLSAYRQELSNEQSYLWGITAENIMSYYDVIETTIKQSSTHTEATSVITFHIPVVDQKYAYKYMQISGLPFLTFNGQTARIVKIPGLSSTVDILVTQTLSPLVNKKSLYRVDPDNVIMSNPNDIAATLKIKKLHAMSKPQVHCINAILKENVTEIASHCDMVINHENFLINKITDFEYLYFSRNMSEVSIDCPTRKPLVRQTIQTIQTINYGQLSVPPTCDVISQTTKFVGKPTKLDTKTFIPTQATFSPINDFSTLNTTLWISIIHHQSAMKKAEVRQIMAEILDYAEQFTPELLANISANLQNELKGRFELAQQADHTAWQKVLSITNRPQTMPFLILIAFGVVFVATFILIRRLISTCRAKPTVFMALSSTEQSSSPEDILMDTCIKQVDKGNDLVKMSLLNDKLAAHSKRRIAFYNSEE